MKSSNMHRTHEYSLCRLCLCSGGRLIDIFEEKNMLDFAVEKAIEDLLQLKVAKEAGFPWLVCSTCLEKLTEFRLFKLRCVECQLVFDNRVKKRNFSKARAWKTGIQKVTTIKTEEENADGKLTVSADSEMTDSRHGVEEVGDTPGFATNDCSPAENLVTSNRLPQDAAEIFVLTDAIVDVGTANAVENSEMAVEGGVAQSGARNVKEATSSSSREKRMEGSILRMLLLSGWTSKHAEHVEPHSAQGEVVVSDNVGVEDDGSRSEEVTLKLEDDQLDSDISEVNRNAASVSAEVEVRKDDSTGSGSALRRLLEENSTAARMEKASGVGDANSAPVSRPNRALGTRVRPCGNKVGSIRDRVPLEKSARGDAVNHLGDLEAVAPGDAVETSDLEGNQPSENVRRTETGTDEQEDGGEQVRGGNRNPKPCAELDRGILKSLLMDHSWISSPKAKRRILGSDQGQYPISADPDGTRNGQDSPASSDVCAGRVGKDTGDPRSPSGHSTGSEMAEECDLDSDSGSVGLSSDSDMSYHPCDDGISEPVAVWDRGSSSPVRRLRSGKRYSSGYGSLTGDSDGLNAGGLGGLDSVGEDVAAVMNSSTLADVASVGGEHPDWGPIDRRGTLVGSESRQGTRDASSAGGGNGSGAGTDPEREDRDGSPVLCLICRKMQNCRLTLLKHMRADHPEQSRKCAICSRVLCSVQSMQNHLEVHEKKPEFLCEVCGRTFANGMYLERHRVHEHLIGRYHRCPECDDLFPELSGLAEHSKTHSGSSQHSCVFCGRTFGDRATLKAHFRSHADDGRRKCENCQQSFPHASLFRDLGERRVSILCKVCREEIDTGFRRHVRSHEPYEVG